MKEAFEKLKERLMNRSNDAEAQMYYLQDKSYLLPCMFNQIDIEEAISKAFCDAKDIVSEIEAEFENDACEWEGFDNSLINNKVIWTYKTSCKKWCIPEEHTDKHFQFCPYCGKKIKVVE